MITTIVTETQDRVDLVTITLTMVVVVAEITSNSTQILITYTQ